MRIPILYQDPDLVVVDKPAGIPTHAPDPGDPYPGDALRIVQAQTGLPYLGMHQRLDADTSGVLLFAARREANKALAAAFEGHAVRKVYLALVHGAPPRVEGVIDAPIVREHGERYRATTASDPRGLAARTRYRVCRISAGDCRVYVFVSVMTTITRRVSRITQYAVTLHAIPQHPPRTHPRNRPAAPDSRPPGAHRLPGGGRSALRPGRPPCSSALSARLSAHAAASGDGATGNLHCPVAGDPAPRRRRLSRRRVTTSRFQSSRCLCSRRYRGFCG